MTKNEEQELLTLTRDNNKMLREIWTEIKDPNGDLKNFIIDVFANLFAGKINNKEISWTRNY